MRTLLFALLLAGTAGQLSAQNLDKTVQKTAKALCDCMNKDLKVFDKDVLDAFIKMLDMESAQPGSGQTYIMGLNADMQGRFIAQLSQFGDNSNIDQCLDASKLEAEIKKLGAGIDSGELMQKAVQAMAPMKKCQTVHKMLSLGMGD